MHSKTASEAVGGADAVLRHAHAWHERVMADEIVAHPFGAGLHPHHTERLGSSWGEAWGGPPTYSERYGTESDVVRIHSGNGPHEAMERRSIVVHLGCRPASMSELAAPLPISLAAEVQHVQGSEASGLVATHEGGRVPICHLELHEDGPECSRAVLVDGPYGDMTATNAEAGWAQQFGKREWLCSLGDLRTCSPDGPRRAALRGPSRLKPSTARALAAGRPSGAGHVPVAAAAGSPGCRPTRSSRRACTAPSSCHHRPTRPPR